MHDNKVNAMEKVIENFAMIAKCPRSKLPGTTRKNNRNAIIEAKVKRIFCEFYDIFLLLLLFFQLPFCGLTVWMFYNASGISKDVKITDFDSI